MKPMMLAMSVLALGAGVPAGADPISGAAAAQLLFPPDRSEVATLDPQSLAPEDADLLRQVIKDYLYYAAVAIAPEEALLQSQATTLVANHHSPASAATAALAGCDALRQTPTPCKIAATVRPVGWEARALHLSAEASAALASDYGNQGARALAISASTGFFGLASGDGAVAAAVAACADKGASDCAVVVADPQ
jgi:hypothetical protein